MAKANIPKLKRQQSDLFKHRPGDITLIVLTFLAWIVTTVICCLANPLLPRLTGLFSENAMFGVYYSKAEPPIWVHWALWGLTYLWQLSWLIYGLTTISRYGTHGYLYFSPEIIPFSVYALFILSQILHTAWIFLWAQGYFSYGVIAVALIAFVLYWCMFLAFTNLRRIRRQLDEFLCRKDIFLSIAFAHNGLALYASMASVVTIFGFIDILILSWGLKEDPAITVGFLALSIELLIWFFLDICLFDRYSRYTVTPYIVPLVWMAGNLVKIAPIDAKNILDINVMFAVILTGVAFILLIIKVIVLYREPIFERTVPRSPDNQYNVPQDRIRTGAGKDPLEMTENNDEDDTEEFAYVNKGAMETDLGDERDNSPVVTNEDYQPGELVDDVTMDSNAGIGSSSDDVQVVTLDTATSDHRSASADVPVVTVNETNAADSGSPGASNGGYIPDTTEPPGLAVTDAVVSGNIAPVSI
ncbi:unnamed protein product [Owenia fusiformis]|uniref:Uncharacterized protein n=1 Tax=Owenia fusiformis TaxID=6347 RepID=A0A8J1TEL7_OWEFU|nr:unnamed protein product [Owenia fusiformis]